MSFFYHALLPVVKIFVIVPSTLILSTLLLHAYTCFMTVLSEAVVQKINKLIFYFCLILQLQSRKEVLNLT